MKVPFSHYISFWLTNSLMALGSGILAGLILIQTASMLFALVPFLDRLPSFLVYIILGGLLLAHQLYMFSFFWGKRRGEFEYSFLETSVMRNRHSPELWNLLKEVKHELRMGDPTAAHLKLAAATKTFSDNFVVHFKYARSCEWVGLDKNAITAYEAAERLLPASAEALTVYVKKQINRVKLEGPSNKSNAPGLQYTSWL
jgi:hypothetical protein